MIEPCKKSVIAEIPGTQVPVQLFCKFADGHQGLHTAPGTINGIAFEVDFEVLPSGETKAI